MKIFRGRLFFCAVVAFLLFSCSSHKFNQQKFDEAYVAGDYSTCISMLKGKKVYKKDSIPLQQLDIGTLAHYAKNYEASKNNFETCERLMTEGDLRSVAQFESFYLNILNCLNYYNQGKVEDATVEIRKVDSEKVNKGRVANNSLWYIYMSDADEQNLQAIRKFDEDEQDSAEYADKCSQFGVSPAQVNKGLPRKPTEADWYRGSATAYYLGSLFRDASDDAEGARFDRDMLTTLNPKVKVGTKEDGKALLNLLAFSGAIAKKEEVVYYVPEEVGGIPQYLPTISMSIAGGTAEISHLRYKFAYAKATENTSNVNNIVAVAKNIETNEETQASFSLLEDFGEDLKKNVALKARKEYNKIKAKSIIGKSALAISLQAAILAAEATYGNTDNGIAQIVAMAVWTAAKVAYIPSLDAFDKNEIKADVRSAKYLPACSYASNMSLPEGKYNVKVQYKNGDSIVKEEEFAEVPVKASSLNLVESICLD